MTTWFLKDARGHVVGPLSREVAVDLLRSRPGLFVQRSTDSSVWQPVTAPATQTLVDAEEPRRRAEREEQEAQRAELELDRLREFEPHHLFGVPKGAALKDYRRGFLNLAKRYHPARLPLNVSPALLRANSALYQYLTEVMHGLEQRLGDEGKRPVASVPSPLPTAARPGTLPTWQLTALHLRDHQQRLVAWFKVTRETAFVFTAHRLMNLANEAVFFPCQPSLALGTRLGLTLEFEEAARAITSRGAVAWESSTPGPGPRGFGVRLELRTEERAFMVKESQRLLSPR